MKNKIFVFSVFYFFISELFIFYFLKIIQVKDEKIIFIFFSSINAFTILLTNLLLIFIVKNYQKKIETIENILNGKEKISLGEKDPNILKFEPIYNKIITNGIFKHVVDSSQEYILILKNEKIIYANQIFKEKFFDIPENKRYWEIITEKALIDFINSKEKIINLKIHARNYTIVKEKYNEHIVLYMKDTTEIANLESKKREFISYFSHEIRTPITVMKGYLETIMEETNIKNIKEYSKIILKHTDNLIKLLTELLRISELESESPRLIKENFSLYSIIEEIKLLFSKRMKEKNITLELNCPKDLNITADKFAINIIFNNLFDNAIKHTSNGTIKINIEKSNPVIITFEDNGEGIKDEDLPFIFDTFYVGDKGRTKEKSGFGLGLAIVKKFILLHNGSIEAKSKYHFGTKFIIKIPQD